MLGDLVSRLVRIVPDLAASDLRHEWILTLCLVIAVAAVVAPLLILMGLKHGTISTLRERLVEDPAYREIRPVETQEYGAEWFDRLKADPRVGFVLPTILPASSIIQVLHPQTGKPSLLDLLPSAERDPLMESHGLQAPGEGQIVLTRAAARSLGVSQGDELSLRATRRRNGRAEYGEETVTVTDILPAAAGTLPRVYTPLQMVLDVERFKEGMSVASRGWKGQIPRPFASYDGVLVLAKGDLDPLLRNALLIESGLADIQSMQPEAVGTLLGQVPAKTWQAYVLTVPRGSITRTSYKAVQQKMRGRSVVVLPFVKPIDVKLEGQPQRLLGVSLSSSTAKKLGISAPPWGGLRRQPTPDHLLQVLLPEDLPAGDWSEIEAHYQGKNNVAFPLHIQGSIPGKQLTVPLELAAILRTGRNRSISFDPVARDFRLTQVGYRGFRLYARSIDDVPSLAEELKAEGVPVIAEIEAIRRIQVLDSGLSRLFWLIAILGVGGGVAVLVASLYASVERKSRDLAMLRLIGLSRMDLFAFPVYEGVMIAAGGLLVSLASYALLSTIINQVFASEMAAGEKICSLPWSYLLGAALLTLGIATFSALFAAAKATRIDPADAIRTE